MATIIVTIVLSSILVLALIDAGMGDYRIRWFPGQKQWVHWTYDRFDRPVMFTYDWETGKTSIVGPKVWTADYYSPSPGHWLVDGCPISYKFTDSNGRWRYFYRTKDGFKVLFYDDVYPPKKIQHDEFF